MKQLTVLFTMLAMASLLQAAVPGTMLFSDSYDRPNNTDIDASAAGMSGLRAPLVYQEVFEGSGQAASIQVLNNQLNVAVGAGMSSLYLDHNFIDAEILAADGFSVSLDVTGITTADDIGNRFDGFGVGLSQAEAAAARDSFDAVATALRPALHLAGSGVANFYADLALDQNVRLWNNGTLLNTIAVGAVTGTIRVDFLCSDFNAGSEVTAVVYFNGEQIDMQTFAWDHTDANYIGISGRTAGAGVFLDNLSIATVYEDKAHLPYPADGEVSVNPDALALSWNMGKDASGNPNPAIIRHYLYIAQAEPNFLDVSPITVTDTVNPIVYDAYPFATDELYYWRVDESINGSTPADANTITGYVWSFDTSTFPVITDQPDNAIRFPAADLRYEGPAVFTCRFTSITAPTAEWFREAGDVDEPLASGGDVAISITPLGNHLYDATLTIDNIEKADEGSYFCRIVNQSGETNAAVSDAAVLGVKRRVAHWTLDLADFVGNQYLDSSGEGHHADPNAIPGPDSFTSNTADPAETAEGLDLAVDPLASAHAGEWIPSRYTGEVSVSAWVNWAGPNGAWQGLISNRTQTGAGFANFFIEIRQDNGNLQFGSPGFPDLQAPPLPTGEWVHVAVSAGADAVAVYVNGEALATNAAGLTVPQNLLPLYIGSLNRGATGPLSPLNGRLDEVQVYNYALSNAEVADLYYEVLETPVCLNLDGLNLQFDVVGGGPDGQDPDCRVSLADFAAFAADWLNCGLYPASACP